LSKSVLAKAGKADKWECIRRLRYGAIIRLIRHRYKIEIPNDDAGRPDLWELMCNLSLHPTASVAELKMRHALAVWTPWMDADEVEIYIEHVNRLPIYERTPTARKLGENMLLSNADRERLKLWAIKPYDMTDAELEAQRKTKINERRRAKRQARKDYQAASLNTLKPWHSDGISRATWYRRNSETSPDSTILFRGESIPVSSQEAESQKGNQQRGSLRGVRRES
jgi:hypothetical protein